MLRQCWRCNTILCDSCYLHAWGTTSRGVLKGTIPAKWEHQLCSHIPAVAHLCSRCKGISDCCIPGKSWKRCFPTRRWRRNPLCNSWKRCFPTRRRRSTSIIPGSAASPRVGGTATPLPQEEALPRQLIPDGKGTRPLPYPGGDLSRSTGAYSQSESSHRKTISAGLTSDPKETVQQFHVKYFLFLASR